MDFVCAGEVERSAGDATSAHHQNERLLSICFFVQKQEVKCDQHVTHQKSKKTIEVIFHSL